MSRLSGFIGTLNGEEVFAITWKNYLEMDSFIWGYALGNHLAKDHSLDDDNTTIVFNDFDAFSDTCLALSDKLENGFNDDMIMSHTAKEAEVQWARIEKKILGFLTDHNLDYYNQITFEFFSCV